jgi:hypothetical protein
MTTSCVTANNYQVTPNNYKDAAGYGRTVRAPKRKITRTKGVVIAVMAVTALGVSGEAALAAFGTSDVTSGIHQHATTAGDLVILTCPPLLHPFYAPRSAPKVLEILGCKG